MAARSDQQTTTVGKVVTKISRLASRWCRLQLLVTLVGDRRGPWAGAGGAGVL